MQAKTCDSAPSDVTTGVTIQTGKSAPEAPADAPSVTPEPTVSHGIDPDVLALAQKLAALPPEARAALKALLK